MRKGVVPTLATAVAILLLCLIPFGAPQPAAAALGPNLLKNPDFSQHSRGWTLERAPGLANATLEWLDAGSAPRGARGRVARVSVTAIGPKNWHVQFYQTGLSLKPDIPYTVSFWAKADRPRPLSVSANVDVADGHGIGLTASGLSLSPRWRKYSLVFTASDVVPGHDRLTFILGESVGTVDLAGIALQAGKPGIPAGPNLIVNGDFSRNGQGWIRQSEPPPASGTVNWLEPKGMPGGVKGKIAHAQVKALGSQSWHVQLYQTGLDLREAEPYTLTFRARADADRPIGVVAGVDEPDWHGIGLNYRLPLTPHWRAISVSFTPTQTIKGHGRLAFVLGDAVGSVEPAGISLRHEPLPASEQPVHPLVGAWENRHARGAGTYRFVFNADGTGSIQVGAASAAGFAPRAPVPHAFLWYVTKQAGRIMLASRPYSWSISGAGDDETLVLKSNTGKKYVLQRSAGP